MNQNANARGQDEFDGRTRAQRTPVVALGVTLALGVAGVGVVSPYALFTVILDFVSAMVVFVPAMALGHALLHFFRINHLPQRWSFILSAGLGLGSLSIGVLIGGLLGWLHRPLWLAVLGAMLVAGLWSLRQIRSGSKREAVPIRWHFLWILAAPFLTLALLAAANAPGMIWQEEGNGYDVLEYHLQLPKEYYETQQIRYLPHNVYSAFPANMEMLYLLTMIVHRDVFDIGTTANMIHLLFGVLAVVAAWAIGTDFSARTGIVAGVLTASCTWLEYLGGLAYVENAMIFYGLCAIGMVIRSDGASGIHKHAIIGGLLAGCAAGCKYTAIPMLAVPTGLILLLRSADWRTKLRTLAAYSLCLFLTLSPWIIKNWVSTGNPVFPLMNAWWNANPEGWSSEQTASWNRGHSVAADTTIWNRLYTLWQRVPADHEQRFGPAILGMGLIGLFARKRDRTDLILVGVLVFQLIIWLCATHLYGRFALPFLVPLVLLGGRAGGGSGSRYRHAVVVGIVIVGAVWNFAFAMRRHARESAPGLPASVFYTGQLPGFEYLGVINESEPTHSKWLLLGEARPFYVRVPCRYTVAFNRHPLFNLIAREKSAEKILQWLHEENYSHLMVHWGEIRRIAATYGFHPPLDETRLSAAMESLVARGLRRNYVYQHPLQPALRYVELYEVRAEVNSRP